MWLSGFVYLLVYLFVGWLVDLLSCLFVVVVVVVVVVVLVFCLFVCLICFSHGDLNDHNMVVSADGQRVTCLLDFGDSLESTLVYDLAICMAYLMLDKEEPIAAGLAIARAYHRVLPLEEREANGNAASFFSLMPLLLLAWLLWKQ